MVMCLAVGSVVLLILVLTAGFAIVRTAIPDYYIWGYWTRYNHLLFPSLNWQRLLVKLK